MHWGDVAELHDWFLRPKQSCLESYGKNPKSDTT